ncbi:MAG: ABC-2 transporter permease [Clostridiales bacterium]|uniref:ABC-2 transporter permease n=1 Tax=Aminipila sp. TaxID=2060095 RepID=UPI001D596E1D|nr:ABC-2 transporter permease [Aminipila sp.]MBE6033581.1 ABC-2 transporter permease [Clostridiales bacterium]
MRGLIIKDFLNLKRQVIPMLMFLIVYFFISLLTMDSSFFTGVIIIFGSMLPISALSYDDKAGFAKYALTLPVSRNTLVISKYVMSLILLLSASILAFLNNLLIGKMNVLENIATVTLIMAVGCVIVSISLPAIFKFGVEKGRFIMIGIIMLGGFFGTFACLSISGGNIAMLYDDNGFGFTLNDSFFSGSQLYISVLVLSILIFLLSMSISIAIYRKKDF